MQMTAQTTCPRGPPRREEGENVSHKKIITVCNNNDDNGWKSVGRKITKLANYRQNLNFLQRSKVKEKKSTTTAKTLLLWEEQEHGE